MYVCEQLRVLYLESLVLDGYIVGKKDGIKMIGTVLDSKLSFCKLLIVVCVSCYCELRSICLFYWTLNVVTSSLDFGLTFYLAYLNLLKKIQWVQNKASKLIFAIFRLQLQVSFVMHFGSRFEYESLKNIKFYEIKLTVGCLCLPTCHIFFHRDRYYNTISDKHLMKLCEIYQPPFWWRRLLDGWCKVLELFLKICDAVHHLISSSLEWKHTSSIYERF